MVKANKVIAVGLSALLVVTVGVCVYMLIVNSNSKNSSSNKNTEQETKKFEYFCPYKMYEEDGKTYGSKGDDNSWELNTKEVDWIKSNCSENVWTPKSEEVKEDNLPIIENLVEDIKPPVIKNLVVEFARYNSRTGKAGAFVFLLSLAFIGFVITFNTSIEEIMLLLFKTLKRFSLLRKRLKAVNGASKPRFETTPAGLGPQKSEVKKPELPRTDMESSISATFNSLSTKGQIWKYPPIEILS